MSRNIQEDSITLGGSYGLRLGASHEQRDARKVYFWPVGKTSANNALIELQRDVGESGQLFASISRKTRFPTIKDRYSARMGRALPNPDLKPETARHLELGWRGQPWAGAQAEAALFHARIDDLIEDALVASDQCGGSWCDQARNIGSARSRGVELSLLQALGERGQFGVAWTLLDRDNLADRSQKLTNSPRQRLFAHGQWALSSRWLATASVEAEQGRIVAYRGPGSQGGFLRLGGYAVFGAKLTYAPRADLDFEIGAHNLGDRWYELAEGYPMPGRSGFVNLHYRF